MIDQFDQEAEALLPCLYPVKNLPKLNCGSCDRCIKRPAVAARLRADAKVIFQRNKEIAALREKLAQTQAEVERLKEANEHWHKRVERTIASEERFVIQANTIIDQAHQLAQAQAEIERLKKFDVQFHEHYENLQPVGRAYDLLEWQAKLQTELGLLKVQSKKEITALRSQLAEAEGYTKRCKGMLQQFHRCTQEHCSVCTWLAANRE